MKTPLNWRFLTLTVLAVTALFVLGLYRLTIDTDIVGSLPQSDSVIADAAYLFAHHPMQSQVVVDVALEKLDVREQRIVRARLMSDEPLTLSALGREMGVSKERVRQLEERVCRKLRGELADFRPAA